MVVKTPYLKAALFSGFAFASPGMLGSRTASAASFIISRRFMSDLAIGDAMGICPEPVAHRILMMPIMIIFMISIMYGVKRVRRRAHESEQGTGRRASDEDPGRRGAPVPAARLRRGHGGRGHEGRRSDARRLLRILSIQGGARCRGRPACLAPGSRRSKAAPAGGGLCRRLSQRQAPRQPRDLLSVFKPGNRSRAGFGRAPARY